jgi:hypothetical protein
MAEFKKFADFVVGVAGNKSKFGFAVINGYRIGVELVVFLPIESEFSADFQFIENQASLPIGEACNVEVNVVSFSLFS